MPAPYLVLCAALFAAIAYRTYGAFLAARVAMLDDLRRTPARMPCAITLAVMALMLVITGDCAWRWWGRWRSERGGFRAEAVAS